MNIIKIAECINANKEESQEVTLYIQDNGNRDYETIGDLINTIEDDKKYADEKGLLDEFLNSNVSLQLVDIEGQIVTGDMNLSVGWSGDRIILTGNIQSIDFIRRK